MTNTTEGVLEEALRITSIDRRTAYDAATPNHQRIAGAWNWYLGARKEPNALISPKDVSMMMLLLKVAREVNNPRRDNLVDIAGYSRIAAQIEDFEPQ